MLVCQVDEIHDETRFIEDLSADSLDVVNIAMQTEQTYGFHIKDDETLNYFATFGGMKEYVLQHIGL